MSYKIEQKSTEKQKANFIVEYNHNKALRIEYTESYIYALEPWEYINANGEVVDDSENYKKEKEQKEAERIANLKLTKREVFLAIFNDSGITPDTIRASIKNPSALIEMDYANEYYRGNPLIDLIGGSLGYSTEQLDYLFEHKIFPPKKEVL